MDIAQSCQPITRVCGTILWVVKLFCGWHTGCTHLQAFHDLVSNAAAAHCAHGLPLDVPSFHANCWHIPFIIDGLCKSSRY